MDARHIFTRGDSDLISSLNAYEGWRKAKSAHSGLEFCRKNRIGDQAMSQVEEQKIQLLVYFVDAGLLILESQERGTLNKARMGAGRGSTFYEIPHRYNQPISDRALSSIIAMAFYPRILTREGKGWRNVYTNQVVLVTSRSINHGNIRGARWLSFHEAMQNRSGNLNVFETSTIPEFALATLLGDAEFNFFAGVMVLDSGKLKLSVQNWRELMAIKVLRDRISEILDICYKSPGDVQGEEERKWVDFFLQLEA